MDISSYVLLSQQQALRRQLDVVANNMANVSTAGFKREDPLFHQYVERTGTTDDVAPTTALVLDYGTVHDTSQGSFQATGNPLDVMIDGPGYLSVQTADGGTAYTRAGYLKLGSDGTLVTAAGLPVLGEGGRPIVVPSDQAGRLTIGHDGTVSGPAGPLGRIAVTVFGDERSVDPRGDGLFAGTGGTELAAADTKFTTGGVEGSNVEPIVETTNMVEILRAYQSTQQMADSIDSMRKTAIDQLSKFG
ncbi:MAG: flagellar hook-basal body complex protein [Sphingomonas sp.]